MSKFLPKLNPEVRIKTAKRCKKHNIVIPTFNQLKNPELIPQEIKDKLKDIGLWDINPLNLYRITWKNDIKTGLFGDVNYLEIPREITGTKARVIGLVGKYFPTGAHKVGAAFGCLVPRLITGEFDPEYHKAVWPSTGNYCRGGAFDCALLDCTAVAILPEEMSQERFTWLKEIGSEVFATPGCESNVKEIYDKCAELRPDPHYMIFNQFDEFGNPLFHYHITGSAIEEVFQKVKNEDSRLSAYISATGSAGTIAAGDYLKKLHPHMTITATEALQCPTLLMNGFGGHRIEGIGDKHIPWIHNARNTDNIAAIDDDDCMRLLRLFNTPEGQEYLEKTGISTDLIKDLPLLGISSICNLIAAVKTAKYYEMDENDVIFTIFTDSAEMYLSRLEELQEQEGNYTVCQAKADHLSCILKQGIDYYKELSYYDRKAIHNLKYYTWIEQQGKELEELNRQWQPEYWNEFFDEKELEHIDEKIVEFNELIKQ
jgi:cysteine synthase